MRRLSLAGWFALGFGISVGLVLLTDFVIYEVLFRTENVINLYEVDGEFSVEVPGANDTWSVWKMIAAIGVPILGSFALACVARRRKRPLALGTVTGALAMVALYLLIELSDPA